MEITETFAKIIELDDHQVLVTKKADPQAETDSPFIVRVESIYDGKRVGVNLGFATKDHMDNSFAAFEEDQAKNMVASVKAQLKEAAKPKSNIIMPDQPAKIIT